MSGNWTLGQDKPTLGHLEERREREIIERPIRDRALQELLPAIPDELKANQDYTRLAQILENLSESQTRAAGRGYQAYLMAVKVRAIAGDEYRHHEILLDIQAKLQQMAW